MCGIFGGMSLTTSPELDKIKVLGLLNQERGEDSCGLAFGDTLKKGVDKNSKFSLFLQNEKIKFSKTDHIVIGHVRKSTQGMRSLENAHPFRIVVDDKNIEAAYDIIGCHNGNITNWKEMARKYNVDVSTTSVDSKAMIKLIATTFRAKDYSIFKDYEGKAALVWRFSDEQAIYMFHGASKEYNSGPVKEERPLHYFVDPKKKVMYFSSEDGPLNAIAPEDAEIIDLPTNKIWRITPEGAEVIAEIDRTNSNLTHIVPVTTPPSTYVGPALYRGRHAHDDGEFNRNNYGSAVTAKNGVSIDERTGIITITAELLKIAGCTPQMVKGNLLLHELQAKEENSKTFEGIIAFLGNRYYRNGHFAQGKFFVNEVGEYEAVTKRNKDTLKYEGDDRSVYQQVTFEDGLLFTEKTAHRSYIKLKKKITNSEAARPKNHMSTPSYVKFTEKVISEVSFPYPVCSWAEDGKYYMNKKLCNSDNFIKFPHTASIGLFRDGKLVFFLDPQTKVAYLKQGEVVISQETTTSRTSSYPPYSSAVKRSMHFTNLIPVTDYQNVSLPGSASNYVFDFQNNFIYSYEPILKKVRKIATFWLDIYEDINIKKVKTLVVGRKTTYPLSYAVMIEDVSIEEFNKILQDIKQNPEVYREHQKEIEDVLDIYCVYNRINLEFNAHNLYAYKGYKIKPSNNYTPTLPRVLAESIKDEETSIQGYHENVTNETPPFSPTLTEKTLPLLTRNVEEVDGSSAKFSAQANWIIDFETRTFWVPYYDHLINQEGWKNLYKFDVERIIVPGERVNRPILLSTNPKPIFRSQPMMATFVKNFCKERGSNEILKYEKAKSEFAKQLAAYGYRVVLNTDILFIVSQNNYSLLHGANARIVPSRMMDRHEELDIEERNYALIDDENSEPPVTDVLANSADLENLKYAYLSAVNDMEGEEDSGIDELLSRIADAIDKIHAIASPLAKDIDRLVTGQNDPRLLILKPAIVGALGMCKRANEKLLTYNIRLDVVGPVKKSTQKTIDFSNYAVSENFFRSLNETSAKRLAHVYDHIADGQKGDILVHTGLVYRKYTKDIGEEVRMYEIQYLPVGEWEAKPGKGSDDYEVEFMIDEDYYKKDSQPYNEHAFNKLFPKQIILSTETETKIVWPKPSLAE